MQHVDILRLRTGWPSLRGAPGLRGAGRVRPCINFGSISLFVAPSPCFLQVVEGIARLECAFGSKLEIAIRDLELGRDGADLPQTFVRGSEMREPDIDHDEMHGIRNAGGISPIPRAEC